MTKLVITRKANQAIQLSNESGDELALITVLKLERNQVRLLFDAPVSTKIHRLEKLESTNSTKPVAPEN